MATADLIAPAFVIGLMDRWAGMYNAELAASTTSDAISQNARKVILGDPANVATFPGVGYQGALVKQDLGFALTSPNVPQSQWFAAGMDVGFKLQHKIGKQLSMYLSALNTHIVQRSFSGLSQVLSGLDAYLSYYNSNLRTAPNGPFTCLMPPEMALVWWSWYQGQSRMLSAANVFPVLTNLYRWNNGSPPTTTNLGSVPYYRTADTNGGAAINAGAVNGNVPTSQLQGYSSQVLVCSVDTPPASGNAFTLTITGKGQDSTGADHTSNRTWTVSISNANTPGQVLTPAPTIAGDQIRTITSITTNQTSGTDTTTGQVTFYVARLRALGS